jgi:hypothetical protein
LDYDNDHRKPPSPWVTHAELAPMHKQIGSLEKGQEHILTTYAHLRGDMLSRFDALEKLLKGGATAEKPPLSTRELVIIAAALVLGGMVLGRLVGLDTLLGG